MLPSGVIFKLKIHQNVYAAGASSRTPLGQKKQISVLGTLFFFCKFVVAFQQFYFDIWNTWKLLV